MLADLVSGKENVSLTHSNHQTAYSALIHSSPSSGPAAKTSHDVSGEAGGHQHHAQPHLHLRHRRPGTTSRVCDSDRQGASPNAGHPGALQRPGGDTDEVKLKRVLSIFFFFFLQSRHTIATSNIHLSCSNFFQGRSLLCCLLPAVCQPQQSWQAQSWGLVALLLGVPLRLCGGVVRCRGCQPLWRWVFKDVNHEGTVCCC